MECVIQLGQLVINLLRILCANSAWQRRKLGKILQDWRVTYIQLELALRSKFGEPSGTPSGEETVFQESISLSVNIVFPIGIRLGYK
ncbi:hypothetical protein CRG98_025282 [Punica granatum]|uniref:NAA35-like TPR repeats domain-containing protein n=1 Tax=Punica granatum TaxID=22663 RepID=A0A2I0JDI0_PUNGR|nr:hypothetical protein CRG98_025282 [Punica granatum]